MAPPKGTTNNPHGRPPKSKSLTTMLDKALSKSWSTPDGKKVSGKQIMSDMVAAAVVTGRVKFPNDVEDSVLSVKDWIDFVRWVYERVDGKPIQPIGGEADDGSVVLKVVYEKQKESQPDA